MGRGYGVVLIVSLLCLGSLVPLGGGSDRGGADGTFNLSRDEATVWTDSFDDMSGVYTPPGGLVGVEVAGGEVRLAAGHDQGWIASSVVLPPDGMRLDMVLLEVDQPGNSTFEISLLDATEESGEIGFANETILGYRKVEATELSIQNVSPLKLPKVRVQVNLNADGTDRPRLLGWSIYFARIDEWRDDFVCGVKSTGSHGMNYTDGRACIDLSGDSSTQFYEPFPPIFLSKGPNQQTEFYAVYPNSDRTGYKDPVTITSTGTRGLVCDDLNEDGYLDIVSADFRVGGNVVDSTIYWGSSDGVWSYDDRKDLNMELAHYADTGDFDGDGDTDIVICPWAQGSSDKTMVFLNKGSGDFDEDADIKITTSYGVYPVKAGDINNDGYDDFILINHNNGVGKCYYGGEGGPDSTPDLTLSSSGNAGVLIEDIDGDGFQDVAFAAGYSTTAPIFMGDVDGVDDTADYTITLDNDRSLWVSAGDINGDGYKDLAFTVMKGSSWHVDIIEGTAQGWSGNDVHRLTPGGNHLWPVEVCDLNVDGYDDIAVAATNSDSLYIYFGGEDWPSTPDIIKTGIQQPKELAVAIPKGETYGKLAGSFTTELISLPEGKRWDILDVQGEFPPGSSVVATIYDSSKRRLTEITDPHTMNLDLSMTIQSKAIYLKFVLRTESENVTPSLDRVIVNWQDEMTWREQFYGGAKIERMLGFDLDDGMLMESALGWDRPQLVFSSYRSDTGFNAKSQVFFDGGGLDYGSTPPMYLDTRGASTIDIADVNHDGYKDLALAIHGSSDTSFTGSSPLFLNSPTGWPSLPTHTFPTTGAADMLLEDLNDDGHVDVVFAQEMAAEGDYMVNSTLFWGSTDGWADTPDVEFVTTGAVDVEAFDHDGDGDLDLVFACYKASSTDIDSMVFTQDPDGFNGSTPSLYLPTKAARGVATGDLNQDTYVDLVFANSFDLGRSEIDSYIYWGNSGGGFDSTPTGLPTIGAEDVLVADVDNDGHLDIVFANSVDNSQSREVPSYVYLNDGSGAFGTGPDASLPTVGAVAVAAGDLDGSGWKDLVFACQYNGTSYSVPSVVYLGGTLGWSTTPDLELPTEGASDAVVVQLMREGVGGYISKPIEPEPADDPGTFHTFRYTATMGPSQSARIQLVDGATEEVLAEETMLDGTNEWVVAGEFSFRDHPSIRVVIVGEGLDESGTFEVDDLWLNWSKRVRRAPQVVSLVPSEPTVYRTASIRVSVRVEDEYDLPGELSVLLQHAVNGTGDWGNTLLRSRRFVDGNWTWDFIPRVDTEVGAYDFRVWVTDSDRMGSGYVLFPTVVEVLNNIPTSPQVNLLPARADTTSTLQVEIVRGSQDVESTGLTYRFLWYLDGVLQPLLVADSVDPLLTEKAQNWSVEVRASDGLDESPPAIVWRVIDNAAPRMRTPLQVVYIDEDTVDSDWIDLSDAFEDPDGDTLTWTVNPTPDHIGVDIDQATGKVTLTPAANWNGEEELTFIASDGELHASQKVTVNVAAVNDLPRFATVNGKPVGDGPVEITIKQGGLLSIDVLVLDEEGDELVFDTNSTLIDLDGTTGSIRWTPDNDMVGTLRFGLTVWDVVTPAEKVTIDFVVTVENENDPMSDPRITSPKDGASFDEEILFSLIASCSDPDTVYGQILNYSWSSNLSGHLGYGSSLNIALTDVGTHVITLTVTDGGFEKRATVTITITPDPGEGPPPNGNGGGGGTEPTNYGLLLAIVVVLVIVGVVFLVTRTRKRTDKAETADEEEYKRDHMVRAHAAIKDAADALEAGKEEAPKEGTEDFGLDEVDVKSTAVPQMSLSMDATKTEAASEQTMALFTESRAAEPVMSEEEQEQLRLDNLKRKYQNAIGRLPYGIPSEELRGMDWVDLAAALATGEKEMTPEGRETTEIDGRWYYSDADDTGTFLKEHGARPKVARKEVAVEITDKKALLAKLEERFILGEISEEAYEKLRNKYEKG